MNNKGQTSTTVGVIIVAFVTIIVGLILFQAVAQNVGTTTNTVALENDTTMTIAVNDTAQYLTSCRAISDVVIFNETGDVAVPAAQYEVVNNVVYNGALAVTITPDAADEYLSIWTIDATCQPLTYIDNSGGRAMGGLITIFFALLIAVVAIGIVFNKQFKDLINM